MNFRGSFCEPLSTDIIELGDIRKEDIIDKFESIDWANYLRQMEGMREEEFITRHPSKLKIKTQDTDSAFLPWVILIPMNSIFSTSDPKESKHFLD